MAGTAKMSMAEANDGLVVVLIARTVFVHIGVVFPVFLIGDGVGVRAELDHAERRGCAGIRVAHSGGAYYGMNVGNEIKGGRVLGGEQEGGGQDERANECTHSLYLLF